MSTIAQIITAGELLDSPNIGPCELIRGELVVMPPSGFPHGKLSARIARYLDAFVEEHSFGEVTGSEAGYLIARDPDTVRAPDVGFVRESRLPDETDEGFFPGPPDLAVEVLSPWDRATDVLAKIQDWLDAGCRCVWIADPANRTVVVYRSGESPVRLTIDDTLTAGDILPGFQLPLAKIFGSKRRSKK